jgi:hypothetical protein
MLHSWRKSTRRNPSVHQRLVVLFKEEIIIRRRQSNIPGLAHWETSLLPSLPSYSISYRIRSHLERNICQQTRPQETPSTNPEHGKKEESF